MGVFPNVLEGGIQGTAITGFCLSTVLHETSCVDMRWMKVHHYRVKWLELILADCTGNSGKDYDVIFALAIQSAL
jgi:hypothetical protein